MRKARSTDVIQRSATANPDQERTQKDLEILLRERTRDLADALEKIKTYEEGVDARFDHAPFGFLTLAADLHVVYCNGVAERIWGLRRDDLLGKSLWPTHKDERADALLRKRILDSVQQNRSDSFEAFSARTGKWLRIYANPSDGRLHIYLRDITADKKKDEIVTKLWRESRSLTDNSPDLILRFDEHLHCTFANKAVALTGLSAESFPGNTHEYMDMVHEISRRLETAMKKAMRTRATQSDEFELTTKADRKIFSWRIVPESGAEGQIRSTLVIARDVTAQRQEEQVRERLTAAIEEASEGVIVVEPEGTVTYVNEAFCRITGHERTELSGAPISLLGKEAVDARAVRAIRESLSKNQPWSGRFEVRRKGGGEFQCELHVSPVKDASGTVTGFVGIAGDITREIELEAQLRESQKLEAIGTLSGGIAHDFNNMLAVVLGNAELALDDVPHDSPTRHNLHQLVTAALRGRDLVKQILSFSRKSPRYVKPFHLAPLIKETTSLLRSTLPATTEIRLQIETTDDTLIADPGQIQQILMNLATNASQAMGEEGIMTIRLADVCFDGQNTLPDPDLRLGEYLVVSVKDTGEGMDESIRSRIFEPFFSTKELGEGTGLGLSVVYGIVKSYEGAITVNSVPGKGSTFRAYLPKGGAVSAEEKTHGPLSAGKGRILFVDDEEPIASMGMQILSRLGYEVRAETDPKKALRVFSQGPDRFDLVITDQTMPHMSGLTLARHLLEKRPDIPIILSTGYSAAVNDKTAQESGIREVLTKPLTREELARTVKRVLMDGQPDKE